MAALCRAGTPRNFCDRSLAGKLKRMEEAEDEQLMSIRRMPLLDKLT